MRVTFLRMRPAELMAEPTAVSRRKEGTIAVEMEAPNPTDIEAAAGVRFPGRL